MHADAEKLLWDASHAADRVVRFIAGKSFADYPQDLATPRASFA
jgi:hypothetical protein